MAELVAVFMKEQRLAVPVVAIPSTGSRNKRKENALLPVSSDGLQEFHSSRHRTLKSEVQTVKISTQQNSVREIRMSGERYESRYGMKEQLHYSSFACVRFIKRIGRYIARRKHFKERR